VLRALSVSEGFKIINDIEWHDLPVDSISINETCVCIIVTPYDESTKLYKRLELKLSDFTSMSVSLGDKFSSFALRDLEVSSFNYTQEGDRITGEIGILPGNEGFWTIKFEQAKCDLHENT